MIVDLVTRGYWPLVVAVLGGVVFKDKLRELIDNVAEIETPLFKLRRLLRQQAKTAQAQIEDTPTALTFDPPVLPGEDPENPPQIRSAEQQTLADLIMFANSVPKVAVIEAWRVVVAYVTATGVPPAIPAIGAIETLAAQGKLPRPLADVARTLAVTREAVAQDLIQLDKKSARAFVEAAWPLATALRDIGPIPWDRLWQLRDGKLVNVVNGEKTLPSQAVPAASESADRRVKPPNSSHPTTSSTRQTGA